MSASVATARNTCGRRRTAARAVRPATRPRQAYMSTNAERMGASLRGGDAVQCCYALARVPGVSGLFRLLRAGFSLWHCAARGEHVCSRAGGASSLEVRSSRSACSSPLVQRTEATTPVVCAAACDAPPARNRYRDAGRAGGDARQRNADPAPLESRRAQTARRSHTCRCAATAHASTPGRLPRDRADGLLPLPAEFKRRTHEPAARRRHREEPDGVRGVAARRGADSQACTSATLISAFRSMA